VKIHMFDPFSSSFGNFPMTTPQGPNNDRSTSSNSKEPKDPSIRQILSLNPQIVRGKRGLVILACAAVGMLCINCFAWVVPPPNIMTSPGHPAMPPGSEPLLPLSIAAIVLLACSFMTMAFISIWTTLNPPPSESRSHLPGILIVLAIGVVCAWASNHIHFHFNLHI
jgi:hypothetical protein